jgi:hypothetical protein
VADSIRESLTKAFAAAETPPSEPAKEEDKIASAAPTGEQPSQETPPSKADESQGTPPAGASATEPAKEPAKAGAAAPTDPKTSTPGGGPNPPQPPPSPADQAPGSWKPTEKADWDKIPPNARAAIKRREAEASRAFTQSTEARRHAEEYQKVLYPFEPLIQAKGITDPLNQVIKPILQIRAALEVGSPQQKAALIANMVRDFGVDVAALDAAIVSTVSNPGGAPPTAPPPAPSLRNSPELRPLFDLAAQLEQRREAAAAEAIQSVESLPHFEELREDMADIMARAAEKHRPVTIKQAYDWALAQSEYASAPVAPAAPTVTPSEAAAILARSRKAASSVVGAPSGAPGKKPTTLREQIASAMDMHSS